MTPKQDREIGKMMTGEYTESLTESLMDNIADVLAKAIENFLTDIDYSLITDWIGDNMMPEDVFDERALETWAIKNGYEKGV